MPGDSSSGIRSAVKTHWIDGILAGVLAILSACIAIVFSKSTLALTDPGSMDFWFGGDSPRVYLNLTSRFSDHARTSIHPLFSLLVSTPTIVLIKGFGMPAVDAVRLMCALVAAMTTVVLYITLRIIAFTLDAVLYTGLFLSSAAFMFWYSVPETFAWASLSVLVAVLLTALIPYGKWPAAVVLASAVSLSITVTNWIAGLTYRFS